MDTGKGIAHQEIMNQSTSPNNDTPCERPLDELLNLYIENMSVYEKVAYEIAKQNLESSYDMEKSIGFIDFLKKNDYIIRR